ncbi:MAG: class I SAM-dependent methyltransferase [Desulfobacterales bacterium]|jgi:ubiquinone/menaquinone biosynthesis C-methylase UbiE
MNTHVCPASHAGFLSTSLRRLIHNPEKILAGLVEPGQIVADIGCGPGFFTLPLARLVGEKGTVIAADLQAEMLDRLRARAARRDIINTIQYHLCEPERIGITEKLDFILAFYMVHEVPSPDAFFQETRTMLNPGGRMLYVEPKFHISRDKFQTMVERAEASGWHCHGSPKIFLSRAVILQ